MNSRLSEQQNKTFVASLIALALFNFVFLGGEFFFDREIGGFVSPERVVDAQGLILGTSVLGFLAFAPLWMLAQSSTALIPDNAPRKAPPGPTTTIKIKEDMHSSWQEAQ